MLPYHTVIMMQRLSQFSVILLVFSFTGVQCRDFVWHYECIDGACNRTQTTNQTTLLSFAECNLLCVDSAALWPKPTGNVSVSNLVQISLNKTSLQTSDNTTAVYNLTAKAFDLFLEDVKTKIPDHLTLFLDKGNAVLVNITIQNQTLTQLYTTTDEGFSLNITETSNGLEVAIEAETFFGARHGLETLNQLIIFDDIRDVILLPSNAYITDKPAYAWRGLVLDTSRNYIDVTSIKRTISAMAASKMNIFHWHLTDTASFPYVSEALPYLSNLGAYTPSKIYSAASIKEILEYAQLRGVRVVPEFDAPAHVGEGWQNSGLITCFNWQPWDSYCNEPPCGQFDPTKSELYDVLEDLYGDMLGQFDPEFFHMGGDEVNTNCWNSTPDIVTWMQEEKGWNATTQGFINLWNYFQTEAVTRLYKVAGKEIPVILWTSDLTAQENVTTVLPVDKYVIQIWTTADSTEITDLLDKNYTLILSNYDALYLDCGFGSWVSTGNNWCSPYKGWQTVYENKPKSIVGNRTSQVLGSEAALWTEQADSASLDSRLWPRAAALAEVLWSEPSTTWRQAEQRMLIHRERLVNRGINADALEPEWCRLNPDNCPV